MNTPTIAPGCCEHLESLKEFYRPAPRKSRFAAFYRRLLAHRYNPLIRPESPPHADVSSAIHMTLGNTRTAAIRYGNRDSTLATLGLGIRLAASFLGIMVSESTRISNTTKD
jgi:hypothetical protein